MPAEEIASLKIEKPDRAAHPRGRRKALLFLVLIAAAAAAAGILFSTGILGPAVLVDVTTVSLAYPSQSLSLLNASGYIVAQRKAAVASKATGRLVALLVEEGSRIREGAVIARMENVDVAAVRDQAAANRDAARAALAQVRTDHASAQQDYRRYRQLMDREYISRADFEAVETRYLRAADGVRAAEASLQAAEAALKNAEAGLDYTLIRAPFDGVVLTKNADIGDIVTPIGAAASAKAAVATIADMASLQVEVDVSETSITLIRVGQPCEIQLDALPERRFRGAVHTIVPTVDRSKAAVLVKVRFLEKDPRMLPDMSAKVSFLSRPLTKAELKPRLAVNPSSLQDSGNGKWAFVVEGNRVRQAAVQTGAPLGELVEIHAGLKAGDRIVLAPPQGLKDGARIKIAER